MWEVNHTCSASCMLPWCSTRQVKAEQKLSLTTFSWLCPGMLSCDRYTDLKLVENSLQHLKYETNAENYVNAFRYKTWLMYSAPIRQHCDNIFNIILWFCFVILERNETGGKVDWLKFLLILCFRFSFLMDFNFLFGRIQVQFTFTNNFWQSLKWKITVEFGVLGVWNMFLFWKIVSTENRNKHWE